MSKTFERKIRGEIADLGHVSITTAIKIIKHINALEAQIHESRKPKLQDTFIPKVYIPKKIIDNGFTVEVNHYSDIPAGFHPYREDKHI